MGDAPPPLSRDDVLKVARLARLDVPESQVEDLRTRLGAVLTYVDRLRVLDLTGVEPMAHVGEEPHRLRLDREGPTLEADRLMAMAPATLPPFVKIPRVIDGADGA